MKVRLILLALLLINIMSTVPLTSCSSILSSKMPAGSVSMEQSYNDAINGIDDSESNNLNDHTALQANPLPPSIPSYDIYTRNQENEINNQFPPLPNPDIVMYIYPHEAGSGNTLTPVPGYSTVFPMYQQTYYAMPGEVISK